MADPTSFAETEFIYKSTYKYDTHAFLEQEKKWRLRKLLNKIILGSNESLLEIGCGCGFSLEIFRDLGCTETKGIEINGTLVEKCVNKGFDVFAGTFDSWLANRKKEERNNTFSLIFLSHVVEHIQDVGNLPVKLSQLLRPGGRVLLLCPNACSRTTKIFGSFWGWWQAPVHYHHFSKKSLCKLLQTNKFSIETVLTRGGDSLFWLSTLASFLKVKSKSTALSDFQKQLIHASSSMLRYWYFIGDEELIVVAKKEEITSGGFQKI